MAQPTIVNAVANYRESVKSLEHLRKTVFPVGRTIWFGDREMKVVEHPTWPTSIRASDGKHVYLLTIDDVELEQ